MAVINKVKAPVAPYSHQATVGTSAAALPNKELPSGGCVLKADDDNAGSIYIGATGVTTSTGYRLKAGQSVPISIKNLVTVFAIASAVDQKLHVLGS